MPVLSMAMAHNRIPVLDRLTIHHRGPALQGAVLRAAVEDAEGVLSKEFSRDIDLAEDSAVALSDLQLELDPAAMFQVEERRPGKVVVWLEVDGQVTTRRESDATILASHQWLALPRGLALEMLSAHVMPNSPAIGALMDDAADILQVTTGSPTMSGYQTDAQHVDNVVEAIFRAMQARQIRYSLPPASWADVGQKIRTPDEVLNGRVGTCLDTVVVMAAALEQAGIRPLLWIVEGHAFLGYWRQETALDAICQTDVSDVVNLIDLEAIRLVETTMLTAGEDHNFAETARPPYDEYLRGDLGKVEGVVDVWTARQNDLVPLPARARTQDGSLHIVEYRPAAHSTAPAQRETKPKSTEHQTGQGVTQSAPPRVQQWKNALLDLTLRNKLINFTARSAINLAVPEETLGLLEDVLHQRRAVTLVPSDQLDEIVQARGIRFGRDLSASTRHQLFQEKRAVFSDVTAASYSTRFRNLAYKARTIIEETGANNLYVALGSLVWELDGRHLRSPLILVPVQLRTHARQGMYRLELDESGSSTPNYCLIEKLRQVHGLQIPGLLEPEDDGAGIDLDGALRAVRVALAAKGLPYRVEPTADLAILQFAKFRLWKDIDESWQTLLENPLAAHLAHTPTEPYGNEDPPAGVDLDELAARCPVPADASQLAAISDAVAGRTFVLEGPPGTGKSQTITNLLTRAIAEGQRVLFVAEKRAALDVVRSRLEAVGMGDFSLNLHDKGSRPIVVRQQIKKAIDLQVNADRQGLAVQSEHLETSVRRLSRYARRVHEKNGAGMSLYSAHTQLLARSETAESMPVPPRLLAPSATGTVETVRALLRALPDVADPAHPSAHHPWRFIGISEIRDADLPRLGDATRRLDTAIERLPASGPLGTVLRSVQTPDQLNTLVAVLDAGHVPLALVDETRTERWQQAVQHVRAEVTAFAAAAHPGLEVATPDALHLPLSDIHAAAQSAANSSWFGRKKRIKAVVEQLRPGLKAEATVEPKQLTTLTGALLQLQGTVRGLAGQAAGVPGLQIPDSWNPLTEAGRDLLDRQVSWLHWIGQQVGGPKPRSESAAFPEALRAFLAQPGQGEPATVQAVKDAASSFGELADLCAATPDELVRWSGDEGFIERWRGTSQRRDVHHPELASLRRWVALRAHVLPMEGAGLSAACSLLFDGQIEADGASRAFEHGLAAASLGERLRETGLDAFERSGHERTVARFERASRSVRELLKGTIPDDVLRERPVNVATTMGQMGALQRELAKQRRGLGVRALMASYGELIVQLMPCVLVSPDSLARFFPVQHDLFDLVVFDEASQIRVADAIGAIGRAHSVVVVGDSKQMPPTSFGESKDNDDDEDLGPELTQPDEESILTECVQARLPRHWLSWHYRSQDESLIAFSNHQYYEGRLSSFPAPRHGAADPGPGGYGISLVRVDGHFYRTGKGKQLRTNPIEAKAIVGEIRRRFDSAPAGTTPSIGVVTFNQQQRAHIESLIRDSEDERLITALDDTEDEGLFIKNLENVQGDERDVILFSTAFSVNDKGVLPLNFGPLNRGGGERRLNVAITRARRQVVVFSSFDPGQLRAEETSSIGIKHLRAFLDLAAAGVNQGNASTGRSTSLDRHREEIAERLRDRGLQVRTEVGLSSFRLDLSVASPEDPDRPRLAVLLDGPEWADRKTVGDRDGLPVSVLVDLLRWPHVERVWLPGWLADPDAVADRLVAVAHEPPAHEPAIAVPATTVAPSDDVLSTPAPSAPVDPELPSDETVVPLARQVHPQDGTEDGTAVEVGTGLPGDLPFTPWDPPHLGGRDVLDDLPSRGAAARVREAAQQAVEAEGPIHADRLVKLVARAFDLSRVSASRSDAILKTVPRQLRASGDEPFFWPESRRPQEWAEFRSDATAIRPIEHVSLREIGNAMVALCAVAAGMGSEELLRESLALFGGRRLTPNIRDRMELALSQARRDEGLMQRGELYYSKGAVGWPSS